MDMSAIIKTVAPWIGTALTGPLGGMAVQAACSALGLGESTTDALKQAVSGATAEQMLALKQADLDFSARMQELGFTQVKDLEALAVADRKDARAMQISARSIMPASLSVLVTGGFFAVLMGMLDGRFHTSESQALILILGQLSAAFAAVMGFWFGTTSGSAAKTDLLAKKQ